MANRIVYVGDTDPAVMLQVEDSTGVLNLSSATSIEVQFIGANFEFSGTGTPIWPATPDPGGSGLQFNCSYAFAADDTSEVDKYAVFVVVTWSTGSPDQIETFPTSDTLTVLALPVPA